MVAPSPVQAATVVGASTPALLVLKEDGPPYSVFLHLTVRLQYLKQAWISLFTQQQHGSEMAVVLVLHIRNHTV